MTSEIVERRGAHANSQQRVLGSDIFADAADEIERVWDHRNDLADSNVALRTEAAALRRQRDEAVTALAAAEAERDEARSGNRYAQLERLAITRAETAEAKLAAAEARIAALGEMLESHASLLEVIAEDALRANDTVTWSMASTMAVKGRALLPTDRTALDALLAEERKKALEEAEAYRQDAERWRAVMASQRMHFMGSAGFEYEFDGESRERSKLIAAAPRQGQPLHFGMEFWSEHPAFGDPQYPDTFERKLFVTYADELRSRALDKAQEGQQ